MSPKSLSELSAGWDHWFNAPLIAEPVMDYLVVSLLRALLVFALWQMLRAAWRYAQAALPAPRTPQNVLGYWLPWWFWLRWQRVRQEPWLSVAVILITLATAGQLFGGVYGIRNDASPYFVLNCFGLLTLFIVLARKFWQLIATIQHPQ